MDLFIFLGAISASVLVFELLTAAQSAFGVFGRRSRIDGAVVASGGAAPSAPLRRTTWEALLTVRAKVAYKIVSVRYLFSLIYSGFPSRL